MRLLVWLLVAWMLPLGVVRAEEVPYRVDVVGVEGDLRRRVEEASRLVSLTDEPPASLVALRRRADDDVERIRSVLRSEGYYDGDATVGVDETRRPVAVTVTVAPGPAYTIAAFDAEYRAPSGDPGPQPVSLDRLGVELGERARADLVIEAERRLLLALAEQGYPLAKVAERRVVVDHAAHSMRVALDVDTGGLAHFGEVAVTGLDEVRESYVRNRIPWRQGDVFSVEQVEILRKALVDSRLFSAVKVATAQELGPGGLLPITIDVSEAKHRSFGLGASWASSEGFAGRAYWEHRNLFSGGEMFRASAVGGQTRNALDFEYRGPDFIAVDQTLIGSATAEERRTDAFVTRTAGVSAGLEWLLSPAWRASASTALERTFEEEHDVTTNFTLLSFPLELRHDSTDDILDPTRGNRMRAVVRPFVDLYVGTSQFTKLELYDSHYWKLWNEPRTIFAAWGTLGSIRGGSLDEVPADKRFYVGGAGSVRAYGYQMAGPVDQTNRPTGGLSAVAFGGEVRVKVTETIGIVPFVEAGRADFDSTPDFTGGVLWGGGLGVRYHTPLGPVRADVAVPFRRRTNIDDPYQIYLSLGQAF